MTGPEHYREAERLLRGSYVPQAERGPDGSAYDGEPSPENVAQAQAHATLALAAATVDHTAHTVTDTSDAAVEALADFLLRRDWPEAWETYRGNPQRRYEYRCQAAAILAGEAWAIRKAWSAE